MKRTSQIQCIDSHTLKFLHKQKLNDVTIEIPGTFLWQMVREGGVWRRSAWTVL